MIDLNKTKEMEVAKKGWSTTVFENITDWFSCFYTEHEREILFVIAVIYALYFLRHIKII